MSLRRTGTSIRPRTLAAVGLLAAAGLFLTACGPEDTAASSAPSSSSSSSSSSDSSPSSAAPAGPSQAGAGKGVSGTFKGKLAYLAPGKLLVGDQAFWVAEGTEITGAGICGDPEAPGTEKCTVEQLESAAEDGHTRAEVTLEKGIATKVFSPEGGAGDASPSPAGADGTFTGTLTYLAPGKLMVGDRAFFVAEDTEITGDGICGGSGEEEAGNCTPDELEEAAKAGNVKVSVAIKERAAERVTQA